MLYFFFGPDSLRAQEKVTAIREKFLAKNPTGSGLSQVDFAELKSQQGWANFEQALGARGLFFEKQLIIVQEALVEGGEERDKILTKLKEDNLAQDADRVLVFWEKGAPKTNLKLFKFLKEQANCQEFALLMGVKLEHWVIAEIKKDNPQGNIVPAALKKLLAYTGGDPLLLRKEIEKLVTYRSGESISESDVELLVRAKIDDNIFATIEALSAGNKKRSLELLHQQIESGADPLYILAMYVYQFRNLIKMGEFYFQGEKDQYQIARLAGLHPFVVQKGISHLRQLNPEKLKKAYEKLLAIDVAAKTGSSAILLELDKLIIAGI